MFPMLGKSSRFFSSGYKVPKYELPLGSRTLFARSVTSFNSLFESTPFLFLVRKDYFGMEFVLNQLVELNIKDVRVLEFDGDTSGQAESVFKGLADYDPGNPLLVFNTDSIRENFVMPDDDEFGDGFLEVFRGEGDSWSFVEPSSGNLVAKTTEKERISDLCSNGIYGFASIQLFRDAYVDYSSKDEKGESYIAPLFNHLIKNGHKVNFRVVDPSCIYHCGIPSDYELNKKFFQKLDWGSE